MAQRQIRRAGFILLLAIVTVAFGGLIADFFLPLFWAVVLAIVFRPLERWVARRVRGRESLAAVLTVVLIILIVFLPLALVGVAVSREALALYTRVTTGEVDLGGLVERWRPAVGGLMERFGVQLDVAGLRSALLEAASTSVQWIASQAVVVGQNALRFGGQFALMLYVLFFFLRDGDSILNSISRALPLGDARERVLFARFTSVTRATLKGTLLVGAAQGFLGGMLFWILGVRAPVFWGVIMMVLSLLPVVGAALVWFPAAVILIASGSIVRGIIMLLGGTFVVGLADNILRPMLVGRQTRMPDYIILLSTLGGIAGFGLSGVVIGPVIAALFMAVWSMFAEDYGDRVETTDIDVSP